MLWKNYSEKKLWYWLDTYSTRAIESAIFIRHYTLHCLRLCEDIFIILALGSVIFLPQLKCIECKNKGKWFYGIRYNTKYLILILNKRKKIHCTWMAFPGYMTHCVEKIIRHERWNVIMGNGKLPNNIVFQDSYLYYIKVLFDHLKYI